MIKVISIIKLPLTFILCTNIHLSIHGQIDEVNVQKKYVTKDTSNKNDAVLILYNNGTFINFGLTKTEIQKDLSIWFTLGSFLYYEDKVLFKSNPDESNSELILDKIKKYYNLHKDYYLIKNSHKYKREVYKDYPFKVKNDNLIDERKKIEYVEMNN
jgi:hypothetical protein